MAKRPLPWVSCESFNMFKIPAFEFGTVNICRRMQACAVDFLATVTEGLVHSVYKIVTSLSFTVTCGHKVMRGKWTFQHCVTTSHTNLE